MLSRNIHTPIEDKRKDHPDEKRKPKGNRPLQLQTHNMPTDDVENINGTC